MRNFFLKKLFCWLLLAVCFGFVFPCFFFLVNKNLINFDIFHIQLALLPSVFPSCLELGRVKSFFVNNSPENKLSDEDKDRRKAERSIKPNTLRQRKVEL